MAAAPVRSASGDVMAATNGSLPAGGFTEKRAVAAFPEPLRLAAARVRSMMALAPHAAA